MLGTIPMGTGDIVLTCTVQTLFLSFRPSPEIIYWPGQVQQIGPKEPSGETRLAASLSPIAFLRPYAQHFDKLNH